MDHQGMASAALEWLSMKGKTVLITAAAQGIGRASAQLFRDAGAHVIATDIDVAPLADEPGLTVYPLDVTSAEAIRALKAEVGPVDVLFNCAGYVHAGDVTVCSDQDWEQAMAVNVTAMFHTIQTFIPDMLARGEGVILNMASVASSVKGVPNRCAYAASKAAVIGLTKSVAADFITQGVRCNAICPGTVESPSLRQRIAAQAAQAGADEAAVYQQFVDRQPMKRLGQPEEIARLALYLASDAASFTTGVAYAADGGMTL
ncbi:SDR family oxidoreductase [Terasakiispira papahanaumokuakeensis]|uniref:SDR family oxidoreductase n=1 Tax=Terasakiispira papahanaumokuakeensis TaxID=197479 RepID=UPI000AC31B6B|nr:SDR family oxidoreductase [Terasakiispira papahanaumokuakeensis]